MRGPVIPMTNVLIVEDAPEGAMTEGARQS